jgi:hypothetical protein
MVSTIEKQVSNKRGYSLSTELIPHSQLFQQSSRPPTITNEFDSKRGQAAPQRREATSFRRRTCLPSTPKFLEMIISERALAGLLPLIKSCPHLRRICLSLIARQIPPSLLRALSNLIFDDLWLCGSTLITPEKVFRSLITMFPHLEKIL